MISYKEADLFDLHFASIKRNRWYPRCINNAYLVYVVNNQPTNQYPGNSIKCASNYLQRMAHLRYLS